MPTARVGSVRWALGGGLLGREKKNRGPSDSLEQGFWAESRNDLANSDSLSLWEAGS